MASTAGSRFQAFMNHPAGPKTGTSAHGAAALVCLHCDSVLLGADDEVGPGACRDQGPHASCREAVRLAESGARRDRHDLGSVRAPLRGDFLACSHSKLLFRDYARQLPAGRRQLLPWHQRSCTAWTCCSVRAAGRYDISWMLTCSQLPLHAPERSGAVNWAWLIDVLLVRPM